ncbi:Chemotaxis protein CheW [Caloramator mitchellensis]|uniref:Chemotaxis protein CheW n=1 Tax=Caloramator mitchellensis TaxID=908809 RepID=A0A0R3JRC3_CALMK|nr:chemotaxis protein CheW [Caloramator mitchellensis]KRQ86001.1 Chemotaxis protein CheW [Caloramator mitchellensis]
MSTENKIVIFKLDNEEFAADISQVERILSYIEPTKIPESPDYVLGVINYQNNIIPIIDLRKRFGLPNRDETKDKKIIVVRFENKNIGLVVDNVSEVLDIDTKNMEESPDLIRGKENKYLSNIIKLQNRIIMMINTEKIISKEEIAELEI